MIRTCAASLSLLVLASRWALAADAPPAAAAGAAGDAPHVAQVDDDTSAIRCWPILQDETTSDGESHLEALGLFHRTVHADGSLDSMHILTWFHYPDFDATLPAYFATHRWWACPLGAGWTLADGGRTWWVTPLAHARHDADGSRRSLQVLSYFSGRSPSGSYRTALPVYYDTTDCGVRHWGVVPLWFHGPGWDALPPALSATWTHDDGSRCYLLTPLAHIARDASGAVTSWHVLTYIKDGDCQWLAPIWWNIGHGDDHKWGVLGAFMRGRDWWISPAIMSARWQTESGGHTTVITPLAMLNQDAQGRWRSGELLFGSIRPDGVRYLPEFWWYGAGPTRHVGLLPLGWSAPSSAAIIPALTAWWRGSGRSSTAWVTPLAHWHRDRDGTLTSWNAGPVVHSGATDLILPVAWRHRSDHGRYQGILPAYWQWPDHHLCLPLYADGRDWSVLAPIYVHARHDWFAPLALSAHWQHADGSASSWYTPLARRETDAAGHLRFERILTWVRTPSVRTLMPLWWRWQGSDGARRAVFAGSVSVRHDHEGTTAAVLPLCAAVHRGSRLDTSWPFQLVPFSTQATAEGAELHVLWLALWVRAQPHNTVVQVGPLWWSQRRTAAPLAWDALGRLFCRTCNYTAGTYRYRVLWKIPVTRAWRFKGAA